MHIYPDAGADLSIVMPCLNEANTVGICVDEARAYLADRNLDGEVIVVDNGSKDSSIRVAADHGAIVICEDTRGYGAAIRTGICHSRGRVIIIGDCDTTYDFSDLDCFYTPLSEKRCDVMIGNRFAHRMEKGAMPLSHKLGVRFLSACGRLRYRVSVKDFHSGLRGLTREAAKKMDLRTNGMEFATEMIAVAAGEGLSISQTPITLKRCRYDRSSKLRTIRDGLRHLKYIMWAGKG